MDFDTLYGSIKRFLKNPSNRSLMLSLGSVFVTVILLFVLFIVATGRRDPEIEKAEALSDNQKVEIISEVIRNNSKSVISDNPVIKTPVNQQQEPQQGNSNIEENSQPLKTGYVVIDPATGQPISNLDANGIGYAENPYAISTSEYPDLSKYNYRKTTVQISPGPKKSECDMFSYILDYNETKINYEYFDVNQYTYSTERKTQDGKSFSKYTSKYGKNINETFTNAFGEYAVLTKYKLNNYFNGVDSRNVDNPASYTSYPISYALNSQTIGNYYSSPVQFLRVRNIDGKEYYEVMSQVSLDCNAIYGCGGPMYMDRLSPNYINLITVALIDSKSFEVVESSKYLNEVSEANRLYTEKTKVERSLTNFAQVSSNFAYTENTEIRVVDSANYQSDPIEYATRVNSYLSQNQISLLKPNHFSVEHISGKNVPVMPVGSDYVRDRAYYSNDAIGESAYQKAQEAYGDHNPLINTDYSNYRVSIRQYEEGMKSKELIKHMTEFSSAYVLYSNVVKVNGNEYPAQIVEYRSNTNRLTSYPVSFPASYALNENQNDYISYPASYPGGIYNYGDSVNLNLSYAIVFEIDGKVYQVYSSTEQLGYLLNEGFSLLQFGEEEYNSLQNSIMVKYSTYNYYY